MHYDTLVRSKQEEYPLIFDAYSVSSLLRSMPVSFGRVGLFQWVRLVRNIASTVIAVNFHFIINLINLVLYIYYFVYPLTIYK